MANHDLLCEHMRSYYMHKKNTLLTIFRCINTEDYKCLKGM